MFIVKKTLVLIGPPETNSHIKYILADNYNVITATSEALGLDLIAKNADLSCIIMDISTRELDLINIIQRLKLDFVTYRIPIIILADTNTVKTIVCSGELNIDDYVLKPFDPLDLHNRISMVLHRTEENQNINPLTLLPGNFVINRNIQNRLEEPLAVIYADLDNFKIYNDKYGFNLGDKLLLKTAQLITLSIKKLGNQTDFLGHIGGDDFIILSTPDKAESLAKNICANFDEIIPREFYNQDDLKSKKIIARNRQGFLQEFPLISISLAIATNEKRKLSSLPLISQILAELKSYAKNKSGGINGSNYTRDRRGV